VTVTTTSASAAVTGAAGTFNEEDAGRSITATGIPAGTTLTSVTSDTAATLSANATTSGSKSATLGTAGGTSVGADALSYGFFGWSPESDAESESYTVAANNAGVVPPDRITNPYTAVSQRARG
jgi:hypothetical protein